MRLSRCLLIPVVALTTAPLAGCNAAGLGTYSCSPDGEDATVRLEKALEDFDSVVDARVDSDCTSYGDLWVIVDVRSTDEARKELDNSPECTTRERDPDRDSYDVVGTYVCSFDRVDAKVNLYPDRAEARAVRPD